MNRTLRGEVRLNSRTTAIRKHCLKISVYRQVGTYLERTLRKAAPKARARNRTALSPGEPRRLPGSQAPVAHQDRAAVS